MASDPARREDRWQWAHDVQEDGVGFAPFNVMAVFPSLPVAQEATARLREAGLGEDHVTLQSREVTDDPPAPTVEPAAEAPTRRRDAQVAGHVARKVVTLSAICAVAAALVGLLVAVIVGFSSTLTVIVVVVAAVTGAVLGAVWGGEIGSMSEARKEHGVVVGAYSASRPEAQRARSILRELRPLRIDLYDGQGRRIRRL